MRIFLPFFLALASWPVLADSGFNGRWDITPQNEPRRRAWWLEVEGAGTAAPKGKFVSAYAGDLNIIDELKIEGDRITFGFKPKSGGHIVYRARLAGGKLVDGTVEDNGKPRSMTWVGVRAPEIKDKDDGSWKKGKPVSLFNGKDMAGWKALIPDRDLGWTVKDGILTNAPKANNLISEQKFWNFELHAEFRVGEHSNSGIGLRGRYEIQILEDYGQKQNSHNNGALYSRIAPSENASRKAGEWQTFDIRLVGRHVKVVLNGKKIVEGEIEGLTAVAVDANEGEPGPFILQGDHGSVEFRKLVVTPLTR
ncbi:MAG: DUF1080 domain-containing protein [Acidobacteria bacterium]|nr:DUF1080 domain-containing protein [Acidobacteriota bacterium]